jgi:hypothetical protein
VFQCIAVPAAAAAAAALEASDVPREPLLYESEAFKDMKLTV